MENTLITQDRLDSLVELCSNTNAQTIAEVGVYKGGSLKLLADSFPAAVVIGFDTFEGLPSEHWNKNEIHKPGDFNDTDIKSVYEFIDNPRVILVKGLFPDTGKNYKDMIFDFVHIDTDFYEGVKESIKFFYPRLSEGGIMAFDDYGWSNCPGVKKALNEFGKEVFKSAKNQAFIKNNG